MTKNFYDYDSGTWLFFYNPENSAMALLRKADKRTATGIFISSGPKGWSVDIIKKPQAQANLLGQFLKPVKKLGKYKLKIVKAIFDLEASFTND